MTPALSPNTGSLFTLQGALFELLEERDTIARDVAALDGSVDQAARMAELDAINTGIACFVRDKLTTVDDLRAPLKAMEQAVSICKSDAQSSMNQAAMWQNRHDRLKDLIKLAMEQLEAAGQWKPKETKKFESPRGSFTLRGNGGAQPVEIVDETLLPDEVFYAEIRMPFNVWRLLRMTLERGRQKTVEELFHLTVKRTVSVSKVAEALSRKCEKCGGLGTQCPSGPSDAPLETCSMCEGAGSPGVPGARLAARRQSLVVK